VRPLQSDRWRIPEFSVRGVSSTKQKTLPLQQMQLPQGRSDWHTVFYLAFRPFAGYKSCEHRIYKMDSDFAANFKFGARTPLYMRLNHILKDGQYDRDVVGWLIVGWLVSSPS